MRIKGVQKTTLLDFPDLIACTVFTPGCNFKCGFCYNEGIVKDSEEFSDVSEGELFAFLEKRKKVLEGVVVSGGEPTLQKDLPQFLEKVRAMGYKTKLDTNGTNPVMLKELIDKKLVDYVAMDIKGPLEDYEKICGVKVDTEKVKMSIEILKTFAKDFEFRTTVLPKFHSRESFEKIAALVNGAPRFFIQQFVPVDSLIDKSLKNEAKFSAKDFEEFRKMFENSTTRVEFRNLN